MVRKIKIIKDFVFSIILRHLVARSIEATNVDVLLIPRLLPSLHFLWMVTWCRSSEFEHTYRVFDVWCDTSLTWAGNQSCTHR